MLRHVHELASAVLGQRVEARPRQLDLLEPVLIRFSCDDDRPALERLAVLDSRKLAAGTYLLAEVEGELVAAAPLDGDEGPLSDPFRPTAAIRHLLRVRARQIRESQGRPTRSKARHILREATSPMPRS